MRTLVLAAFAALCLTAGIAQVTPVFAAGSPHSTYNDGPNNSVASHYVGGGD